MPGGKGAPTPLPRIYLRDLHPQPSPSQSSQITNPLAFFTLGKTGGKTGGGKGPDPSANKSQKSNSAKAGLQVRPTHNTRAPNHRPYEHPTIIQLTLSPTTSSPAVA